MIDQETIDACRAINARRREERRRFLRTSAGAVVAAGGLSLLAACDDDNDGSGPIPVAPTPTPTPNPTPTATANDVAILNFALNLEYLEANYYNQGAFGTGVASGSLGSNPGTVTGGRAVTFTDQSVAAYIREIAADENAHIAFLRRELGSAAVSQPAINIAGDATGAFTAAARAARVIGDNETFDPYASQDNFLLGGMLLSDVGVTAYKGAAQLIDSKLFLEAAAGILAVEAYHSGLIRTLLYRRGLDEAAIFQNVQLISNARDNLDGPEDLDQGISSDDNHNDVEASNIVPTDINGIVFGRTSGQVLNIAYLNRAQVTQGGFFPNGVNGTINQSANNATTAV